jgi:phage-related minor tail protein
VGNLRDAIDSLLQGFGQLGEAIVRLLTAFELWLRGLLQQAGLPHAAQTVILLLVAVALVLGSLRLFGGLIRAVIVLLLLLIVIHIVLPIIEG